VRNTLGMPKRTRTLAGLDLVGGNAALDFANTINSRTAPEHDYLTTYADVVAWAELAGVLPGEAGRALRKRASRARSGEDRTFRRALLMRESIYRTFSAIAAGQPPTTPEVRKLLGAYSQAVARGSLEQKPGGGSALRWTWRPGRDDVLDPIAYAAGHLLLVADHPPVKECPGCGWLFLDRSNNGRRRWCDMQTCGSRDKMRRFYRSRRAARDRRPLSKGIGSGPDR
jgi:predicted RNA-binding Zn ribbon-like protein